MALDTKVVQQCLIHSNSRKYLLSAYYLGLPAPSCPSADTICTCPQILVQGCTLPRLWETGRSCVLFTYCRQENTVFSPHIHTAWEEPFSAALYSNQPFRLPPCFLHRKSMRGWERHSFRPRNLALLNAKSTKGERGGIKYRDALKGGP